MKLILYRFCRVLYGLAPPFLLQATLIENINNLFDFNQVLGKKILEFFHVDDFVSGEDNNKEAQSCLENAFEIHIISLKKSSQILKTCKNLFTLKQIKNKQALEIKVLVFIEMNIKIKLDSNVKACSKV